MRVRGLMKKRIFISTGEVSGDLQGAMLVEALHRCAQEIGAEIEVLALGGDHMKSAGATLLGKNDRNRLSGGCRRITLFIADSARSASSQAVLT